MGAHVALMSRGGSGSGSNNHKTPSRSCPARTTSEANPSEQSCILYSDMLRCPTDSRPPPGRSPAHPCRSSVSGASHLHLQRGERRSTGRKKKRISFIYSKVSPQPPALPHPLHPPPLLFLYIYIYFCRVEEEKIFFFFFLTCKLDALLGSARATEMQRQ